MSKTKKKRQQLERGPLPKKTRNDLEQCLKFAPRKPVPEQPSRENQAMTSNQAPANEADVPWILDYEWDTYYKKLEKQPGYDYIVTDRFNVLQP